MQNFEERKELTQKIADKIKKSGKQLPDIRLRDWSNNNTPASKLHNLLIEAENILLYLDDIQMKNDQCYPEIEDFMLQIGALREKYTNFVDNNKKILDIK
jgi:hypothetical protein